MNPKTKLVKILTTFLVVSLAMFLSPRASAQIVLKGENLTAVEAISQLQQHSDYVFFYNSDDLAGIKARSYNLEGSLESVLMDIFRGTGITWRIQEDKKEVFLKKNTEENKPDANTVRTVSGIVVDDTDKLPLIGATIHKKGTNDVAIADLDGKFTMSGVTNKTVLEVSFIGFKQRDFRVGDLGYLEIELTSDNELEGVVVVGAGTQKKVSVTGSITAVKGDQLKATSSSLTSNLAGQLAGLVSVTKSGKPGEGSEFYIRGVGTFGGRATPLILLDGIEITADALDRIPPESIDQFSILKDASATAIYGSRGANGVMIITTKEGQENTKAQVTATVECSVLQPMQQMEYVDGARWMEIYNEALTSRYPSSSPRYSQEMIDNTRSGVNPYMFPDVDWYNLLFKKFTSNQKANVNVQGGGSKLTYYMGIQANHDTGLINCPKDYVYDNNYNRWNFIFQNNINYQITNTTKVSLKLNAQFGTYKGLGNNDNLYYNVYDISPVMFPAYFPMQEGDEYIHFGNRVFSGTNLYTNPYAELLRQSKETNLNDISASLKLDQNLDVITKGLTLSALIALNARSSSTFTRSMTPFYFQADPSAWDPADPYSYVANPVGVAGSTYQTMSDVSRWSYMTYYFDARLNYNRRFDDHAVSGMLMYMMRQYREQQLPNRNQGFSGRFTYNYADRYLVEVNFGLNGTERIQKSDRFEFFPAVSLGWVPSNENFWSPIKNWFSHLKVRASYGLVGSDDTGKSAGAQHFLYVSDVSTYSPAFYTGPRGEFVKTNAPIINTYPVEDACWERARKLDVGVDMSFFNSLNLSVDYFREDRDRILMQRASWPNQMGYDQAKPWANVGKVLNQGVDISANYTKHFGTDWTMSLRGTFTYMSNELVYVDEPDYLYSWQSSIGWPLPSYRVEGYIADGLFKDQADIENSPEQNLGSAVMPGDIKYRDINGDGKITMEDRTMISDTGNMPRIQYGFGAYIRWKNLDLGVFFNGSGLRTILQSPMNPFGADTGTEWGAGERQVAKYIDEQRWTEANPDPNATYPRLGVNYTDVKNNLVSSTYWLRNGSFIRFKTLEVGYKFPHCRIFFTGDNLFVWSPFKLWDPELSWNSFPLQRTFNFGVQLSF